MIVNDRFMGTFGRVPAGSDEGLANVVTGAVRAGFAVVLNRPGTKTPLCTLTAREAKEKDAAAREAAEAAGDPHSARRRHACGIAHALTDPATAPRIAARMVKRHGHVNLGVHVGLSRLVCVDVDTVQQDEAFLTFWQEQDPDADLAAMTVTVMSPGSRKGEEWVHRDGGHYWFHLPEGTDLPTNTGIATGPGGFAVMWHGKQVLVPPSVRPEGAYRILRSPEVCPPWLAEYIREQAGQWADRVSAQRARASLSDSPIDAWDLATAWDDVLVPDGWAKTGKVSRCGCPEWTAPGEHASPKSATAHEVGCDTYDTATGAPLHLWTDSVPDFLAGHGRTVSKMNYLALSLHSGDVAAAMRGAGLPARQEGEFPGFSRPGDLYGLAESHEAGGGAQRPPGASDDPQGSTGAPQEGDQGTDTGEPDEALAVFLRRFLTVEQMDSLPPLVPLVDGVLDMDTVNRVVGRSNHGKTFVMVDLACRVVTGTPWNGRAVRQGLVVYMAAEGAHGLRKRVRAWEEANGLSVGPGLLVLPEPVQVTHEDTWKLFRRAVRHLGPVLVVLDTQARITVGAEENAAKDMGIMVEQLERLRREGGACVALVHHLGHSGDQGRGSSSVIAAMSTEIRVERTDSGEVKVVCAKQKDHEFFPDFTGELVPVESTDSAALSWPETDPFDDPGTPERSWPERVVIMVQRSFPTLGMTQAQCLSACYGAYEVPQKRRSAVRNGWDRAVSRGLLVPVLDAEDKPTARFVPAPGVLEEIGYEEGSVYGE